MQRLFFFLLFFPFLVSCGYKIGFVNAKFLENKKTFCVVSVQNPTTNLRLSSLIKTSLRDELVKRVGIKEISCDKADLWFYVKVLNYSDITKVESEKETTLKSELNINVDVKVVDRKEKKEVWSISGLSCEESYLSSSRKNAEIQLIKDLVEKIVDKMSVEF